ncbi:MAG TPA: hypothetical protein VGY49_02960 [Burkholderiaceae bacterium]|jgi:hypothetical protein|nr:hypothetical protein [Burkholderiaceae bacterium]
MNLNTANRIQSRLMCVAAAALASTLVLSSVLWLFSSVDTAPVSAARHQLMASAADHAGAAATRGR